MPALRHGSLKTHVSPVLVLWGLVAVVFLQTLDFEFTNLDDNVYVLENPALEHGLSTEGLRWAFTTSHGNLWMPVTWLSYLADRQFFGPDPASFHGTNVLLHLLNTTLLYLLLWRLPGTAERARWAPFWVAALFAVHPLHVESVAWVAERKDVLSGFFFLLAVLSYLNFLARRRWGFYVGGLGCFALALMAKPMVVTLPVVLLLLDHLQPDRRRPVGRLLLEKVPFLLLAGALSLVTYRLVQVREIGAPDPVPLLERLGQAVIYYALYLWRALVPVNLSVNYVPESLRLGWPVILPGGAALVLLTWGAWSLRHRLRPVPVGWLWFLVMLLPVLDVVQGGMQVMSDRYFYLPSIGFFLALAWLGAGLVEWGRERAAWLRYGVLGAGVLALLVCAALARKQTAVWRDSGTLFRHAVALDGNNYAARESLGVFLLDAGRVAEALPHLQAAVAARKDPLYHFNLANALVELERFAEAVPHFRQALAKQPVFPEAHNNLGIALGRLGQWAEAGTHFAGATRQDPGYAAAWYNLGLVQVQQGDRGAARLSFRRCLEHEPAHAGAAEQMRQLTERP